MEVYCRWGRGVLSLTICQWGIFEWGCIVFVGGGIIGWRCIVGGVSLGGHVLSLSVGILLGGGVLSVGVEVYCQWDILGWICIDFVGGDMVGWRCIVGRGGGVLSVGYPWVGVCCRWG